MEDLTGLGKVAESVAKLADTQLANKAYDDLATGPMREGGKGLTDFIKAFRLFLAPIQLLAVAQDRLAAFCDRVRARVPEDRQQEAAPSIALPILMDLRFMEDENLLTELYLNLLARAIDKERCNEAHPAFVKIIEQMSPDEAMIMYRFRGRGRWPMPPPIERGVFSGCLPIESLSCPKNFYLYAEHLESLNLLRLPTKHIELEGTSFWGDFVGRPKIIERRDDDIEITNFGKQFVAACIPEDFDLATFKSDPPKD